MNYGLPYMGSKSKICESICKLIPSAKNFYDLFGGVFSITHFVTLNRSKHFERFHFNEIRHNAIETIQKAIQGEYNYNVFKPKWIDRETFLREKENDFYIKMIWSFGNNGENYLFSKEIEPYKKSMHNAIVFNEFDELAKNVFGLSKFSDGYSINQKRLYLRNKIEHYRKTKIPEFLIPHLSEPHKKQLNKAQHLRELQRGEQLQQLERLQQLEQTTRIAFYNKSYDEVEILPDSVIYCDPPYSDTADYDGNSNFSTAKFLDWADKQAVPVFISEYNISDSRFTLVHRVEKISLLNRQREKKAEKLYANKAAMNRR